MGNKKDPLWDGTEIKLLTPLSAEFFPNEESGWEGEQGEPGSEELWDGMDLMECMDAIQEAVDRENSLEEEGGEPCNLMEYFYGSDSVKEKVESAVVSIESAEDILYGCTTLHLKGNLTSEEFHELCEYITGQYSDGCGEGFEQRDIQVDGGILRVHFWQANGMEFHIQEGKKTNPENEQTADSGSHARKIRPKLQLIGHDGNIFFILEDAKRLLTRNGQEKEADEMCKRVFKSGSYYEALGIISEYVETELSSTQEKKDQRKQKPGKSPCR